MLTESKQPGADSQRRQSLQIRTFFFCSFLGPCINSCDAYGVQGARGGFAERGSENRGGGEVAVWGIRGAERRPPRGERSAGLGRGQFSSFGSDLAPFQKAERRERRPPRGAPASAGRPRACAHSFRRGRWRAGRRAGLAGRSAVGDFRPGLGPCRVRKALSCLA